MKSKLTIIFQFISIVSFPQQQKISATVKDLQTGEILPYCNVSVVGTNKGTIANSDGIFKITADTLKDILEFSYLGYTNKTIPASTLLNNENVFLQKSTYKLQEVEIHAGNDYLYEILTKSRKKLLQDNSKHISKAYYAIDTKAATLEVYFPDTSKVTQQKYILSPLEKDKKTVEVLECFFNAQIIGYKVNEYKFRNGKVFSVPSENFFISSHSSKAMGQFCFFEKNEIFPSCPFQYSKNKMKKIFNTELISFDGKNYHIKFYPHDNSKKYFSGDVWIEKKTNQVLKINLAIDSAEIYPLVPLYSLDSIKNFSLTLTNSFNQQNKFMPDYTTFEYSFTYVSRRDTLILGLKYKNTVSKISSKGLIYYYDYDNPFILPYYDYDYDYDDYILMCLFPYNKYFWEANNIVQLTEDQKNKFEIGYSLNNSDNFCNIRDGNIFFQGYNTNDKKNGILAFYHLFWSSDKRLTVSPFKVGNSHNFIEDTPYPDELCNLNIQILLDITEIADSILCKSWTVLDPARTTYKYADNPYTEVFFNIYFDICEIERRKMQKQLDENKYSISEIDIIYNLTKVEMDQITKQFIAETDRGRDGKALKKWNKYVLENLGIDNLKLIKNTDEN